MLWPLSRVIPGVLVDSNVVKSMLMVSYGLLVCARGASCGRDNGADTLCIYFLIYCI